MLALQSSLSVQKLVRVLSSTLQTLRRESIQRLDLSVLHPTLNYWTVKAAQKGMRPHYTSSDITVDHRRQKERRQQEQQRRDCGDEDAHTSTKGSADACALKQHQQHQQQLITSDFLSFRPPSGGRLYLVLLNWELPPAAARLWNQASFRICVDGGCNRLYDQLPSMMPGQDASSLRSTTKPDLILGDLDSIRPEVRSFYCGLGVDLQDQSADQMTTDMYKSIAHLDGLVKERPASEPHQIVVLGAIGGRLDHLLSNLNTLHCFPHLNVALWGDSNLVRLVRAGSARIELDRRYEGPSCGLIPMGSAAVASSVGLEWDMQGLPLHWGGLISTSNVIQSDVVLVETDVNLVWTVELREEGLTEGQEGDGERP